MADRFTSVHLPGCWGCSIADYGRKTPEEMIALIRAHAENQKAQAEMVLAASDADFRVDTYFGFHVRNKREVLQDGRPT